MNSNTKPHDAFNSATSGRTTTSSAVRSRNRRLISFTDDEDNGSQLASGATTPRNATLSPYSSRRPSPGPDRFPPRTPSRTVNREYDSGSGRGFQGSQWNATKPGSLADFWGSSWSSLQELASSVLGSDNTQAGAQASGHRRKPSKSNAAPRASRPVIPTSWGPAGFLSKPSVPGSEEERRAMVQAQKRKALLQANGDAVQDTMGNYKRRDSTDRTYAASAALAEENDSDALVYIHHVQPTDSITGVSIRYGCQPAVMRKSNGFWPSDSIQMRNTVLLPVDACTLKGRRLTEDELNHKQKASKEDAGSGRNSLGDTSSLIPNPESSLAVGHDESTEPAWQNKDGQSTPSGKGPSQAPSWHHECWVQIDGFSEYVEIGRVPRRTLGFFPRARRKSQSLFTPYTDDVNDSRSFFLSPASTSASHPNLSSSYFPPESQTRSNSPSTSSKSQPPARPRHRRQRSSIVLSGTGVGTLGRNVNTPGPAPDKLNTFVNAHLPNLSLPPPPAPPTASPSSYPRESLDSSSTLASNTSSSGFENVGGAIEGWVRKMATRAKTGINEFQQQQQQGGNASSLGIAGMGDLIELDDALEGRSNVQLLPTAGNTGIGRRSVASSSSTSEAQRSIRGRTVGSGIDGGRRAKDD